MRSTTRAWFAACLILLSGAAVLHTALLFGASAAWAALVHLTLFGWISAMIVAVNYHTMQVFTGREFPYNGPIWAHLAAHLAGVGLAVAGLVAGWSGLLAAGLGLELLGALLFMLNVILLLRVGVRRGAAPAPPFPEQRPVDRVSSYATRASGLCLPLALALLLGVRLHILSGNWWLAGEHVATLGWVMLMIVGVAAHMLPRFGGRASRGAAWLRLQLGLHLAALALIGCGLGLGWSGLFAAGGLLMAVALALFAWIVWPTLGQPDAGPRRPVVVIKEVAR